MKFTPLPNPPVPPCSVTEFLKNCLSLEKGFVYRGAGNPSWQLVPSAFRDAKGGTLPFLKREERMKYFNEDKFTQDFNKLKAMAYEAERLSKIPADLSRIQQLALFQHNGIPTPLVDWSDSPLVALFMAYYFRAPGTDQLRIYRLNTDAIKDDFIYSRYEDIGFERIKKQLGGVSYFASVVEGKIKQIYTRTIHEHVDDLKSKGQPHDVCGFVDIAMQAADHDLITRTLAMNGFTLETLFPDSPYWFARSVIRREGWDI